MTEEKKQVKKRKAKGEGSVQQLAKDKYKAVITIGIDSQGKQQRKAFTGRTQKEVVEKKNQYLADKQKGMLVATNSCKLSEFITRWLSIKKTQTKTTTYESYVETCDKYIIPALGMHKVQKVTTAHLNDYIVAKLSSGLSPASVIRQRAIIHGILDLAVKEGIVPRNVSDNCNSITKQQKETRTLKPEEMKKVLYVARGKYEKYKDNKSQFHLIYHIVLLALATGMRRGELLAMKWDNIDLEKNTITIKENLVEVKGGIKVETPKTKSSRRVVSIDEKVLKQLEEIKELEESNVESVEPTVKYNWVFHTRDGKPLTPSNVNRAYRSLLNDAEIKGIRFHDLRHTHSTRLVADGMNVKTISARLGHADSRITLDLYSHALPEQDREAAERMGSLLYK